MKKLKIIWFNLIHPKDWFIVYYIKHTLWKIKDYDRLENDYISVVYHATNGLLSKSNYELNTLYSVIDERQKSHYYDIIKFDINQMIENGHTIKDIQNYIDEL